MNDPTATLTEAGWLASDYRSGRFHWSGDVLSTVTHGMAESRYLLLVLSRRALADGASRSTLADLDHFAAAMRRHPTTVYTAAIANSLDRIRDNVYVRLAIQGRLDSADLHRWCQEPPLANQLIEDGFLGESLLLSLPQMEDVMRWGESVLNRKSPPDSHTVPDLSDWLSQPQWIRMMLDADRLMGRIREALAGRDRVSDIVREVDAVGVMAQIAIPSLAETGQFSAQMRLAHSGKRLMAWLIEEFRQGRPLPETLATVVPAVAEGQTLLGGSDLAYGLRYQKFSNSRFRLEIDPAGRSPVYADPGRMAGLVQDTKQKLRPGSPLPPIVIRPTAWEADVQRLGEPAATNVVFPDEDLEPRLPRARN